MRYLGTYRDSGKGECDITRQRIAQHHRNLGKCVKEINVEVAALHSDSYVSFLSVAEIFAGFYPARPNGADFETRKRLSQLIIKRWGKLNAIR